MLHSRGHPIQFSDNIFTSLIELMNVLQLIDVPSKKESVDKLYVHIYIYIRNQGITFLSRSLDGNIFYLTKQ